tara:strand:- start:106 stop:348 length:243 start_codon:yes stop_codon:yes gene_type:complete
MDYKKKYLKYKLKYLTAKKLFNKKTLKGGNPIADLATNIILEQLKIQKEKLEIELVSSQWNEAPTSKIEEIKQKINEKKR